MFFKMKQSQKEIGLILLAFFILILFAAVSRFYALYQIDELKRITEKITEHPLKVSNAALNVQLNVFKLRQQMVLIVFFPDKAKLQQRIYNVHQYEEEAHKNLGIVNRLILGKDGESLARETEQYFHERAVVREQVISLAIVGNTQKAVQIFQAHEASYLRLDTLVNELYLYAKNKAALYDNQVNSLYEQYEKNNNYSAVILAILFALIIYYTVHRIAVFVYHNEKLMGEKSNELAHLLAAQEQIKKLSTVVEQIDDSVVMTDKNGHITYVNNACCDHTGYHREEILGNTPRMFKAEYHKNNDYKRLWETILSGKTYRETLVNKKKNGDLYYEDKTITPLRNHDDIIIGFVSTGKDVTKEMLAYQETQRIASTDQLTEIYNRHKFEELLNMEIERAKRTLQPLSLILIDIDHFKNVNDTFGHDAGDEVLKHLVKIIQDNIRQIDIFARWGGEEFLVLSPSTDLEKVQVLAEKLRFAVEKAVFPIVSHITISQGVGIFEGNDTFDEVFKRVDLGLYHAKEHGRNQVGVITS